MFIKIHTQGFTLSEALRDYTDSKMRLSLGLYKGRIQRVDVFLTDVNGPKGGEDMLCKIKVKADGYASMVAQETAADIYDAINGCSHRIKRAVGRRLDRQLQRRRSGIGYHFDTSLLNTDEVKQ